MYLLKTILGEQSQGPDSATRGLYATLLTASWDFWFSQEAQWKIVNFASNFSTVFLITSQSSFEQKESI